MIPALSDLRGTPAHVDPIGLATHGTMTLEIRRLRGILRAIVEADERGQGVNFGEAMNAAVQELNRPSAGER